MNDLETCFTECLTMIRGMEKDDGFSDSELCTSDEFYLMNNYCVANVWKRKAQTTLSIALVDHILL